MRLFGFLLSLGLQRYLLAFDIEKQLLASRFEVETRFIKPRMRANLVYRRTTLRIIIEECHNEVFKLLGESFPINFVKIEVSLSCDNQVVEVFFSACLFERENTVYDDE